MATVLHAIAIAGSLVTPAVPEWYSQPYIVALSVDQLDALYSAPEARSPMSKIWPELGRDSWMRAWPSGTRFETHCRIIPAVAPTCLGMFQSLDEAMKCALPLERGGMQ